MKTENCFLMSNAEQNTRMHADGVFLEIKSIMVYFTFLNDIMKYKKTK